MYLFSWAVKAFLVADKSYRSVKLNSSCVWCWYIKTATENYFVVTIKPESLDFFITRQEEPDCCGYREIFLPLQNMHIKCCIELKKSWLICLMYIHIWCFSGSGLELFLLNDSKYIKCVQKLVADYYVVEYPTFAEAVKYLLSWPGITLTL